LGKCTIFGPMGVPNFGPFHFLHYFTALPIIDNGCSIFQYIMYILRYFWAKTHTTPKITIRKSRKEIVINASFRVKTNIA